MNRDEEVDVQDLERNLRLRNLIEYVSDTAPRPNNGPALGEFDDDPETYCLLAEYRFPD